MASGFSAPWRSFVTLNEVKGLGPSLRSSFAKPVLSRFFGRGFYSKPDPSVASLPQDDRGEGLSQNDRRRAQDDRKECSLRMTGEGLRMTKKGRSLRMTEAKGSLRMTEAKGSLRMTEKSALSE